MIPVNELFELFPKPLLDRLAMRWRVNRANQIRLPGQTVFVCLLDALVNQAVVTQRLLEDTSERLFGCPIDHSSFGKRLAKISPRYFEALFEHLYSRVQGTLPPRTPDLLRLRFTDATTVTLSARLLRFGLLVQANGRLQHPEGGPITKRHVKTVLERRADGLPRLLHLCRDQAEANDNQALGDPMLAAAEPADLWVFDSGCFDRDRLLSLHRRGAFFLTPHHGQALQVQETLAEYPAPPPTERAAPPGKGEPTFRLRRVEYAVFGSTADQKAQARREKWESMPLIVLRGERWERRTRQWKPLVLLTNLPLSPDRKHAGPYTFWEVTEVYRQRWGMEVLFKFLKQYLSYDHLTSRTENGIRVMIWMALIAALLLLWYRQRTGIDRGWRSVKFWFGEEVREWTRHLLGQALAPAEALQGT